MSKDADIITYSVTFACIYYILGVKTVCAMISLNACLDYCAIKFLSDRFRGCVFSAPPDKWNPCYEMLFCVSGEMGLYANDEFWNMSDGSLAVVGPYTLHNCFFCGKCRTEMCLLRIKPEGMPFFIKTGIDGRRDCVIDIRHTNLCRQLLELKSDMLTEEKDRMIYNVERHVMNIGASIDSIVRDTYTNEIPPVSRKPTLATVVDIVRNGVQGIKDTAGLCTKVCIKGNTLNKIFRRRFCMSTKDFIDVARLTKAKDMIRKGDNVKNAWKEAGYGSYSSYNRSCNKIGI